jgi:serine/threonine protein kinase/tetratricopeptide (TPR) repeat protein
MDLVANRGGAGACPDPESFVAFLAGELDEHDAAALESHVDRCTPCCELVAALARSPLAGARASGLAPEGVTSPGSELDASLGDGLAVGGGRLARGMSVGRYIVTEELGSGGMGVVYGAYDPELDRRVALKLLRARARSAPGAEARLLREARAIARLSHRNVVAVYDVGVVDDDGAPVVWVAMELVEGVTLRRWATARGRGWRDVVAAYVEAGRGLAAAHAAGIVHRDFKPGNVLVADDGRVVVLDFGLARIVEELDRADSIVEAGPGLAPRHAASRVTVTRPHAVLGTPAYMAPEQRKGEVADERSDQYAFCLALAEALLGAHPVIDRPDEPLERVVAGTRVPAALRRVLARGLAERPADRFVDMRDALLALERVLGRRHRIVVAGGTLALGGALAVLAWSRSIEGAAEPCSGGERRMAETWSPDRKDALSSAFAGVERPWTERGTTYALAAIDAWSSSWIDEYTEACRATHVWREQSEHHLDLRMACLDRARGELGALLIGLERAPADGTIHAAQAVDELPELVRCRDVLQLAMPSASPSDPAVREQVERVHAELAHAHARERLGDLAAAREQVELAYELARRAEHRPTVAEVLRMRARMRMGAGELDAAEADLYDALWASEDGRDDRGAAEAWIELVWLDGYHRMAFERAQRHAQHARAAIERAGGDAKLEAVRLRNVGWTEARRGDPRAAIVHYRDALAQLHLAGADEGRDALLLRNDLGGALGQLGEWKEARAAFEGVRLATEAWLGPDHPELAIALNNVGSAQRSQGELAEAKATFERVVGIFERAHGREDLSVGRALLNLGTVQADMGDEADALASFERAEQTIAAAGGARHPDLARAWKGIAGVAYARGELEQARERYGAALELERAELGVDHPSTAVSATNLAAVLVDLHRAAEAIPLLRDAVERMSTRLGADHPDLVVVHDALGFAQQQIGAYDVAAEHFERAIDIAERASSPDLAMALLHLGRLELERERAPSAMRLLERALALREAMPDHDPVLLAQTRWALAQALAATRQRRRARELAVAARDGIEDAALRAEIEAWLAARGG